MYSSVKKRRVRREFAKLSKLGVCALGKEHTKPITIIINTCTCKYQIGNANTAGLFFRVHLVYLHFRQNKRRKLWK